MIEDFIMSWKSPIFFYIYIDEYKNFRFNIDLLFFTLDICDKTDTNVYDKIWGSDHFPVCFNISTMDE